MVLKHNPNINKVFDSLGIVGNARCTNPKETKEKHTTQHKQGRNQRAFEWTRTLQKILKILYFFKYLYSGSLKF